MTSAEGRRRDHSSVSSPMLRASVLIP